MKNESVNLHNGGSGQDLGIKKGPGKEKESKRRCKMQGRVSDSEDYRKNGGGCLSWSNIQVPRGGREGDRKMGRETKPG